MQVVTVAFGISSDTYQQNIPITNILIVIKISTIQTLWTRSLDECKYVIIRQIQRTFSLIESMVTSREQITPMDSVNNSAQRPSSTHIFLRISNFGDDC